MIGSNTVIRNTLIKKNVRILDNCIIGKHGFGFFPNNKFNVRYPHIGIVLIEENCEIGCGSTIDRGSMSNTHIGKNTYLDNQIHIAHNVKIGENSIIAGQVGIAGSSVIGNNVRIGGQAGISGHLKIGNNVEIAGGSGVIKDIPDNSKVMGYPAKNIREFLKDNK
jgi:UDP-3-O-[3-hydroxymyristoyl] glucosamine N-acyltransferase